MVMMLHTGVPGSGKTYLMVNKIASTYFDWEKDTQSWVRKEDYKDLVIVSNIESLTLEHKDLDHLMEKRCHVLAKQKAAESGVTDDDVINEYYWEFYQEKVRWFFDYEYQKRLTDHWGAGIIYCLEEVQNYFDTKRFQRAKWARDVCFYFEKHRHMGHSIYMDTQHNSKIASDIRVLFETEIAAKPRTMSITGEFRYNEMVAGSKVNNLPIVCQPQKRVFSAYKSMSGEETVKTKKPIKKLLIGVFLAAVFCVSVFTYAKHRLLSSAGVSPPVAQSSVALPPPAVASAVGAGIVGAGSKNDPAPTGAWFRVSWVRAGDDLMLYNPVDMVLQDSSFFPYRIRRSGSDFFAFIPDTLAPKKDKIL